MERKDRYRAHMILNQERRTAPPSKGGARARNTSWEHFTSTPVSAMSLSSDDTPSAGVVSVRMLSASPPSPVAAPPRVYSFALPSRTDPVDVSAHDDF